MLDRIETERNTAFARNAKIEQTKQATNLPEHAEFTKFSTLVSDGYNEKKLAKPSQVAQKPTPTPSLPAPTPEKNASYNELLEREKEMRQRAQTQRNESTIVNFSTPTVTKKPENKPAEPSLFDAMSMPSSSSPTPSRPHSQSSGATVSKANSHMHKLPPPASKSNSFGSFAPPPSSTVAPKKDLNLFNGINNTPITPSQGKPPINQNSLFDIKMSGSGSGSESLFGSSNAPLMPSNQPNRSASQTPLFPSKTSSVQPTFGDFADFSTAPPTTQPKRGGYATLGSSSSSAPLQPLQPTQSVDNFGNSQPAWDPNFGSLQPQQSQPPLQPQRSLFDLPTQPTQQRRPS
eukprot:CAMPEP_0168515986 /NCGR_PEP_ID=MMETSP0405-20121227/5132_1 /TAXON_ID=498012 /ORGANISM="Trichosphaerium sp, Strain Am-I-7 wt" /LENGTH=346 /DNA_ID=CAMNT_0008535609 /DNA_START=1 /DNA_END=1038 /DNA_ORIENTATION=+